MKAKYIRSLKTPRTREVHQAGHVVEHPDAWKLVLYGAAVPADEECSQFIVQMGYSEAELKAAVTAYERSVQGMMPDPDDDDDDEDDDEE